MAKCKREGCKEEAETRAIAKYRGYCSLYCRDIDETEQELEDELAALRERVREMEEIRQGQRDIIDDYIGRMNAMQAVVDAAQELIDDYDDCDFGFVGPIEQKIRDALAALEDA